jgi:hypothetical protein
MGEASLRHVVEKIAFVCAYAWVCVHEMSMVNHKYALQCVALKVYVRILAAITSKQSEHVEVAAQNDS